MATKNKTKAALLTLAAMLCLSACRDDDARDDAIVSDFEIGCLEWQSKSVEQRFLDGPATRDACSEYLKGRTQQQIESDQKFRQLTYERAKKEWDEYEKKTGHR